MKKSILFCFLMFVFCLCCSFNVSATETTTIEPEYDDAGQLMVSKNEKGHVVHGFIRVGNHNGSYWNDYTLNLIGDTNSYIYVTYNSAGNNKIYILNVVGECSVECNGFSVQDGTEDVKPYTHTNIPQGGLVWVGDDYKMCDDGHKNYFTTNLPVFDSNDTTAINNYINNGDYSGADNSSDVDASLNGKTDKVDSEIPLPHNVQVLQGADQTVSGMQTVYPAMFSKDIVISWSQDDVVDDLQYVIEGQFTSWRADESDITKGKDYTSAYFPLITDKYNGSKSVTVKLNASMLNNFKETGYLSKLKLRIRNKLNNTTSNWVVVSFDFKEKSATASEDGYADGDADGDTDGDEYNDTNVNIDNNNGGIDVSGVTSYIRDGFGLLGNGGLISLMSQVFLYIPNSVWTIIKFFISSIVIISLFAFTIKVVF